MDIWFKYQLYFGSVGNYVRLELPDNIDIPGILESIAAAAFIEHRVRVGDCTNPSDVSDRLSARGAGLSYRLRTKGEFNPALLYQLSAVGPGRQEHVDNLLGQYPVSTPSAMH